MCTVYIHKKRTVKKRRGNDIKRRVVEMCIIFTTRFLCIVDNKKYTNRKRWETQAGIDLVSRLEYLLNKPKPKQVAKMYSAFDAEDEINYALEEKNARVASVTPVSGGCVLVIFEIPS